MMSKRLVGEHREIELGLQPLAIAIDDAVAQPLLDGLGTALLGDVGQLAVGEQLEQPLQRIVVFAPAVVDQVLGDLNLLGGEQVQRADLADMHDRAGHAGPHRMVEEHRVQHRARGGIQSERDVGQAEDDLDVGVFLPDQPDALDGPLAELAVVLGPGRHREGEGVDQQVRLRQAVLVAGELDQARRHRELALRGLGHALLVDGQRDHRGAELLGQDQPVGGGLLAILEIDRVDDRLAAMQLERRLDDVGLGAVDHQRRIHAAGETCDHLVHLGDLVAADEGGADVEAVGALGDLLAPDRHAAVPVAGLLQFAPLARAVGVATLADREVAVLLAQRHLAVQAGHRRHPDRRSLHGDRPGAAAGALAQHGVHRLDMRGRGAAAAADQVEPVLGDEALHPGRHLGGSQGIMRLPVHQLRQAGIGLHRQQAGPVGGQPADVLGHLLRPGGAVQSEQRHVEGVDGGGRRRDVGANQQGAGGLDGDLHEDRGVGAGFQAGQLGAVDGRLDLQRVLAGLDQQRIDAAGDQAAALRGEGRLQRIVGDVAQARQLGARADRADHPAVAAVREAVGRLAGQLAGDAVDLVGAILEVELGQRDRRAAEAVGLDHVGAGLEVAAMDLAHQLRPRQVQHLGAVLAVPVVRLDVERQALNPRAHAAVAQQHLVAQGIE